MTSLEEFAASAHRSLESKIPEDTLREIREAYAKNPLISPYTIARWLKSLGHQSVSHQSVRTYLEKL